MKSRIIEIVELGHPKSLIQRENEPITELIDTNFLIEELNQVLSLFSVSGQSEQFICDHPMKSREYYSSVTFKCWKCGKIP